MATDTPVGDETAEPQFNLRQIYLKDLSYEAPNLPDVLFGHDQPQLKFYVESSHKLREADIFDVVLELNVHAMAGDKSLFLIEIKQGGLFEITGYSTQDTIRLLKTKAAEALYPYARELVSSLVGRGGFPRLNLRPLNFEQLYAEAQQQRAKA